MLNKNNIKHILNLRREYINSSLCFKDLPPKPQDLFQLWLKQAFEAKLTDPNALIIATVDRYGQPYQRIVLLKDYDKNGLIFYTNLNSRKAQHIKNNPRVSLIFPWHMIGRQIIISGKAKRISPLETMKYFQSRPRNSQISTWASKQSSKIPLIREELENKFFELIQKFQYRDIPLPKFWGGFRISIEQIEFWQGGRYRLHDRFLYQRKHGIWKISRLAP